MMNIDFHVHGLLSKKSKFDEELFLQAIENAKENGLNTFVLCEHFNAKDIYSIQSYLRENYEYEYDRYIVNDFSVFIGMEIDIKNGGHVILCGNRDNIEEIRKNLEDYITKPNFIDFEELLDMGEKCECLMIGSHPYRETKNIIGTVYDWCIKSGMKIEIVINDWGMIKLLEDKTDYFTLSLGVLLNKRKKDPRYIYKKGYEKNKDMMSENNLNSKIFSDFLKENKIERYEYENCGYEILIGEGKHSLQMPFYVTNTSQYCTLYAMCKNLDRGSQKLVNSCPKYCMDYVFAYPKHLKMVGKYNSLFAFDDTLLKDRNMLEKYVNMGIDRIVLNFI